MILIVDGDKITGSALERLLRYRGFDALFVQSGAEVLTLLDIGKPEGLILELVTEGIDGMTLLKAVRKDAAFADVPVIIYASKFADETLRQAMEFGAQDYIVKGTIGWKSLVKRIERFCPQPRKERL